MKKMLEFLLKWKEDIICYNKNPFRTKDIKRVQVLVPALYGEKLLVDVYDIKELKDFERVLINAPENIEITIQIILKNFRIANLYITNNPEFKFDVDYYEFIEKLKKEVNCNECNCIQTKIQ